ALRRTDASPAEATLFPGDVLEEPVDLRRRHHLVEDAARRSDIQPSLAEILFETLHRVGTPMADDIDVEGREFLGAFERSHQHRDLPVHGMGIGYMNDEDPVIVEKARGLLQ